jgi:hypothetical protein
LVEHGTYSVEPHSSGGCRLTLNSPRFRVTNRIRREMNVLAKQLGICVCFDEAHNGNKIFTLTERDGHRSKSPFEDRVRKFAARYAPGGPERDDTLLASIQLAGAAV